MSITVKWGRERLHLTLPPPETKLAHVRRTLAEYTHLPEGSFKLIHKGSVMRDDNAPSEFRPILKLLKAVVLYGPLLLLCQYAVLSFVSRDSVLTACTVSAYQIRPNSTLSLIGTAEPIPSNPNPTPRQHQKPRAPEPKTEQSTITQIQTELDRVRQTLEPDVDSFLHTISPSFAHPPTSTYSAPPLPTQAPPDPSPRRLPSPEQEHNRLSELLLQALLRLDAITSDGSWETARAERKKGVREVQGLLDRLDDGWNSRVRV